MCCRLLICAPHHPTICDTLRFASCFQLLHLLTDFCNFCLCLSKLCVQGLGFRYCSINLILDFLGFAIPALCLCIVLLLDFLGALLQLLTIPCCVVQFIGQRLDLLLLCFFFSRTTCFEVFVLTLQFLDSERSEIHNFDDFLRSLIDILPLHFKFCINILCLILNPCSLCMQVMELLICHLQFVLLYVQPLHFTVQFVRHQLTNKGFVAPGDLGNALQVHLLHPT
mmetsp:Transcript_52283/g.87268  ORF Transcript_52283/g.87268 Transcript_52283/m.87268 type:complete len:225 (+) Transcript_52283:1969-2643(+)